VRAEAPGIVVCITTSGRVDPELAARAAVLDLDGDARPEMASLTLGSLGTLAATPLNLALLVERLPAGATWGAAGIGRYQFAMNRLAIAMGGGVRVGLEDNIWFDDARTDPASNPRLVERLVTIARAMGREPATPDQVRQRLGIRPRP
jgi:3-keto-5-aminohexanoate cleavage enzyme